MANLLRRQMLLGAPLAVLVVVGTRGAAFAQPTPHGPRKRLFVESFQSLDSFDLAFGGAAGDALAAQLATVLSGLGEFDVVDRSDLASLQVEQGLNDTHGSVAGLAQHNAQILGAQVMVKGYITTFDATAKSSGLTLGFGGSNLNGALGGQSSKGVLGMDIRLTDTATALVLGSTHIEERVNATSLTTSVTGSTASLAQQSARNSVLGQVTREAFARAAMFVREKLEAVPWTGLVAQADGDQVFINIGAAGNANVGDVFAISRVAKRVVDPASGELLGVTETPVGRIKVDTVQQKFSIGTSVSGPIEAQQGDIVRYVSQ